MHKPTELEKLYVSIQSSCTTLVGLIGLYVSFIFGFTSILTILIAILADRHNEIFFVLGALGIIISWIINFISVKLLNVRLQ